MKYTVSIHISKLTNEATVLFDDLNNLKHSFPNLEFTGSMKNPVDAVRISH